MHACPCSVVMAAAVSALSTVVTVLAKFISPYLQQITLKVGQEGEAGEGRGSTCLRSPVWVGGCR